MGGSGFQFSTMSAWAKSGKNKQTQPKQEQQQPEPKKASLVQETEDSLKVSLGGLSAKKVISGSSALSKLDTFEQPAAPSPPMPSQTTSTEVAQGYNAPVQIGLPKMYTSPQSPGSHYVVVAAVGPVIVGYTPTGGDEYRVRVQGPNILLIRMLALLQNSAVWGKVKSKDHISVVVSKSDLTDALTDATYALFKVCIHALEVEPHEFYKTWGGI